MRFSFVIPPTPTIPTVNTIHNVQIGSGTASTFTQLPPSVSTYPVVSQGAASDPAFSNTLGSIILTTPLAVNSGGTGISNVPAGSSLVGTGGGRLGIVPVITPAMGGTGVVSLPNQGLVVARGSDSFTAIPASVNLYPVASNGIGPQYQNNLDSLSLYTPLPVSSGGTGLSTVPANNLLVGNGGGGLRAISVISVAQGGTGASSLTDHALVIAHGSNSFTAMTTSVFAYSPVSQGPATDPIYSNAHASISITEPLSVSSGGTGVASVPAGSLLIGTGGGKLNVVTTLPVALGGTGASSFTSNGILVAKGSGAFTTADPSTIGRFLRDNGPAVAPSFTALPTGTVLLNYVPAVDNATVTVPVTTWTTVIPAQTFQVTNASQLIDVVVGLAVALSLVTGGVGNLWAVSTRILIDGATAYKLGSLSTIVGVINSDFIGMSSGTINIGTLAVGNHTVAIQVYSSLASSALFRASTQTNTEFANIQVIAR